MARRGGLALRPQELLQLRSAVMPLGPAPAPAADSGEVHTDNIYNIYNTYLQVCGEQYHRPTWTWSLAPCTPARPLADLVTIVITADDIQQVEKDPSPLTRAQCS